MPKYISLRSKGTAGRVKRASLILGLVAVTAGGLRWLPAIRAQDRFSTPELPAGRMSMAVRSVPVPTVAPGKTRPLHLKPHFPKVDAETRGLAFRPVQTDSKGQVLTPDPRMMISVAGKFTRGETYLGPNVHIKLNKARYRSTSNGPWTEVGPEKRPSFFTTSDLKSMTSAEVDILPESEMAGEWQISGVAEVWLKNETTQEVWRASTPFNHTFGIVDISTLENKRPQRKYLHEVPPGPKLVKVQYQVQAESSWQNPNPSGGPWKDALLPGQPGYPTKLSLYFGQLVNVRAVRENPKLPWPVIDPQTDRWNTWPKWILNCEGNSVTHFTDGKSEFEISSRREERPKSGRLTVAAGNEISLDYAFDRDAADKKADGAPGPWLANLECSRAGSNKWTRMPLRGEPGFPFRLELGVPWGMRVTYKKLASKTAPHPPGLVVDRKWQPNMCAIGNNTRDVTSHEAFEHGQPILFSLGNKKEDDSDQWVTKSGDILEFAIRYGEKGEELLKIYAQAVRRLPNGTFTPGPIPPMPPGHLEISEYGKKAWKNIPVPGQPGYPMVVHAGKTYQVKLTYPVKNPWAVYDALGYNWPKWLTGFKERLSDSGINFEYGFTAIRTSADAQDLYKLSVTNVSTVSTGVRVIEDPVVAAAKARRLQASLSAASPSISRTDGAYWATLVPLMALRKYNSGLSSASVGLNSSMGLEVPKGTVVRLRCWHENGQPAGQVNGPGAADDTLLTESEFGLRKKFKFESDNQPGMVNLQFEFFGEKGKLLGRSAVTKCQFDDITVKTNYKGWSKRTAEGAWEREIRFSLKWASLPNGVPFNSETLIQVEVIPPTTESAKAVGLSLGRSKFAGLRGVLKSDETLTESWAWSPGASRQLDDYRFKVKPVIQGGAQ